MTQLAYVDALNTLSFPDADAAVLALFCEGFDPVDDVRGMWRSKDGLVDASIHRRQRDGRFYLVLFA